MATAHAIPSLAVEQDADSAQREALEYIRSHNGADLREFLDKMIGVHRPEVVSLAITDLLTRRVIGLTPDLHLVLVGGSTH